MNIITGGQVQPLNQCTESYFLRRSQKEVTAIAIMTNGRKVQPNTNFERINILDPTAQI